MADAAAAFIHVTFVCQCCLNMYAMLVTIAVLSPLLLLLLQELLAERPAWPLELLLCRIPGSSEGSLAPALQALCYQFKTGARNSMSWADAPAGYSSFIIEQQSSTVIRLTSCFCVMISHMPTCKWLLLVCTAIIQCNFVANLVAVLTWCI
jgi:hypothetical protein